MVHVPCLLCHVRQIKARELATTRAARRARTFARPAAA
jgi:hypothetical protein